MTQKLLLILIILVGIGLIASCVGEADDDDDNADDDASDDDASDDDADDDDDAADDDDDDTTPTDPGIYGVVTIESSLSDLIQPGASLVFTGHPLGTVIPPVLKVIETGWELPYAYVLTEEDGLVPGKSYKITVTVHQAGGIPFGPPADDDLVGSYGHGALVSYPGDSPVVDIDVVIDSVGEIPWE